MDLVKRLQERDAHLAVVGLGYVGLPLAVQFARHYPVIGLDLSEAKLSAYREGHDVTEGVGDEALGRASITYTSDMSQLVQASFIIVAVPTPVHADKTPDLGPVVSASHSVGRYLQRGSVVVYESTVYPGVTEELCRPILEQESGLVCGRDFKIGYSPERINPGDRKHGLEQVTKIVSGCDDGALDTIAQVYGTAIPSIYRAASIKVAEAAKLVENAQRDVNIAFMNELSRAFHHMTRWSIWLRSSLQWTRSGMPCTSVRDLSAAIALALTLIISSTRLRTSAAMRRSYGRPARSMKA